MKYLLILVVAGLLSSQVFAEKDYTEVVKAMQAKMQEPSFKGSAFELLAFVVDTYGPRLWGSAALEQAIYELASRASKAGFDSVHLEEVKNFTKWVRGKETLTLYEPRPFPQKLGVIGLGSSVGGYVNASAIVCQNWDDLQANKDKVKGKIVVFNNPWIDYFRSVEYRVEGASRAAKYGAVAVLVRSVASMSIYSVHTGYMEYDPSQPKIPAAAITVEDAEMFQRMQDRGQTINLELNMQSQFISGSYSNNLIFEIRGSEKPDEVVLAGGHIDSWDTGSQTGSNDDGGGFVTVFEALRLIKELQLRPKRTLRFIAWSGEESGADNDGAAQYLQRHSAEEIKKHVAVFESDLGSTRLKGIGYSSPTNSTDVDIVKGVIKDYMTLIDAGDYSPDGESVDSSTLFEKGVPMFKNLIKDTEDHDYYFRYHHSAGDSLTMMNPEDLDSNVLGIAAFLYIIADLEKTVRNP